MKYVIISLAGVPLPIVFPDMLVHSMAVPTGYAPGILEVFSAGQFSLRDGKVEVFGKSESLKVGTNPKDPQILEAFLSGCEALLPTMMDDDPLGEFKIDPSLFAEAQEWSKKRRENS